jgi:glycosyltransferase involved in cell wall biosynthesis
LRKLFPYAGQRTITVSNAVRSHLVKDFKINQKNITVVYNGIEKEEFQVKTKTKIDAGLEKDDIAIGMIGRVSQEKGHFLAIEACRILFQKYPKIYFLMTGEGKQKSKVLEILEQDQHHQRVKFLSWQGHELLDILDVLLVPSTKEGFGYIVLEAFAKGVAVVGSNVGGISEIIRPNENGLLFSPYDAASLAQAIEQLILNKELRAGFVETAKVDVGRFSLLKMAEETQRVYSQAIEKKQ